MPGPLGRAVSHWLRWVCSPARRESGGGDRAPGMGGGRVCGVLVAGGGGGSVGVDVGVVERTHPRVDMWFQFKVASLKYNFLGNGLGFEKGGVLSGKSKLLSSDQGVGQGCFNFVLNLWRNLKKASSDHGNDD